MPGDVTIYDVAAEAGVSISTVSLTLNRPDRVKASTRRHVLEVIDRLGFTPRADATSYARRNLPRIGVLAPFTAYDSYRRRLAGVLTEATGQPNDIVVFDQVSAAVASGPLLDSLPITHRLDGLLIMGLPLEDHLARRLVQRHLPTVLVDSRRPEFTSITINDEHGGYLAGRHLAERGHTSFAVLSEPQRSSSYLSQAEQRRAGFRKAIGDARFIEATNDISGGRLAARELLSWADRPTAVFAHQDLLAAGVLLECRDQGLRLPDDLAVIGFDDGPLAEALDITTVRQPLETSGRLGLRLLHEALADPQQPVQQIELELQVIERRTT
jgi:DNA-binding LacI/PurR family transcriptional regulator